MSTSTPIRGSSGLAQSSDFESGASLQQADLKKMMQSEIDGQVWQVSPEDFARMLSPSTQPDAAMVNQAHASFVKVMKSSFFNSHPKNWHKKFGPEPSAYRPLSIFLNLCFQVCRLPPRNRNLTRQWFALLDFIAWGLQMKDGPQGSQPLKPDLAAGSQLSPDETSPLYWSPPNQESRQALSFCEVKDRWSELIQQAATYARCLFDAEPLRKFAVGLGFNQKEGTLRFLIFHRGGVTTSTPLSVDMSQTTGIRGLLRICLALLRSTPTEAGIPPWTNNILMDLPVDDARETFRRFVVEAVLYYRTCVRGRATRVMRLSVFLEPIPEVKLIPQNQTRRSPRFASQAAKAAPQTPTTRGGSQGGSRRSKSRANTSGGKAQESAGTTKSAVDPIPDPISISSKATHRVIVAHRTHYHHLRITNTIDEVLKEQSTLILKTSWTVPADGNINTSIETDALSACSGQFGCQKHVLSFRAADNCAFIPTKNANLDEFLWNVFRTERPASAEIRVLWAHLCAHEGVSLVSAHTPWELFLAIGHAMLGWLMALQKGYLSRDISIGNVYLLHNAIKTLKFSIDENRKYSTLTDAFASLSLTGTTSETATTAYQAARLTQCLQDLGIKDECRGFTTDYDMAAEIDSYFDKPRGQCRSGTAEFMSDLLLLNPEQYLQSPVDDLQSFYYIGQWAVIYNTSQPEPIPATLQELRRGIAGTPSDRALATTRVSISAATEKQFGSFFTQCSPFLREWKASSDALVTEWAQVNVTVTDLLNNANDLAKPADTYLPLFFYYAFRGVANYLDLLKKYKPTMTT